MILLSMLLSASVTDCASAGSNQEMQECWGAAAANADRALNAAWPSILTTANKRSTATAKDLLEAQRSWLRYRDAQCRLESDYAAGGTLAPIIFSQCYSTLTNQRTHQLEDIKQGFQEN